MSFIYDTAASWLGQKKDLERLRGVMGPLEAPDQRRMGQMQQNVQGGLLQHMGQQYLDRLGQRTGLSAFGVGSDQAYKPWSYGMAPGPGAQQQQGLLARVPQAGVPPGGAVNVPPGTTGLRSKLMQLIAMGV
jgi:hypothetical protein